MDKSKKIYIKALDKYNNGYIDKSIELCEESISLDIHNTAAINLKGLLYYLKGDLQSSRNLWKMNWQINKDKVSEKYLSDTQEDISREKLYKEAVALIKELKINRALELLERCSESDYNSINVNNYKAFCYIKKGEFIKAEQCINKVKKIDKNNKVAKESINTLKAFGVSNKSGNNKNKIYGSIVAASLVVAVTGSVYLFNNFKNKQLITKKVEETKVGSKANQQQQQKKVESQSVKQPAKQDTTKKETVKEETFPRDKINTEATNKNFDDLYADLIIWKDKSLSQSDKDFLNSAIDLMKTEGVEYFYNKGSEYLNNQDYKNVNDQMTKAYAFGSESYLYPHIVYLLGVSYEALTDNDNAYKYYAQYDSSYANDGDYEETVLYKLALIANVKDKTKAKEYANKLIDKYPKSIYNNSVINGIINQ